MTRRERHVRIIENFGLDSQSGRYYRERLLAKRNLTAFNDEAIRELAAMLVSGRARSNKLNKQNRELAARNLVMKAMAS